MSVYGVEDDEHELHIQLQAIYAGISTRLCLANLDIRELPEDLPDTIQLIDVRGTMIRELPERLPKSLHTLICHETFLKELPPLPASLKKLDVSGTNLKELIVPQFLTWLDISGTRLREIPPLPNTLSFLACSDLEIDELPDLPIGLTTLICTNTNIRKIHAVPRYLQNIYLNDNVFLEELPTFLAKVGFLQVSNCPALRLQPEDGEPDHMYAQRWEDYHSEERCRARSRFLHEEIAMKVMDPVRIHTLIEKYGVDVLDDI